MQKYKYNTHTADFEDGFCFDLESFHDTENLDNVAEDAAEDFYSCHAGWESSWPVDFYLFTNDGIFLGCYPVDRETNPAFYAGPRKDAPQETKE